VQYPQVSADLSVRWCSAYLKIDVGACAIRGQERFEGSRTLVVSGERAEESSARAKYATFERDRTDARDGRLARHVDRWRPVHGWTEAQVWAILQRWSVNPHPAYRLGYGRVSCALCIFGGPGQFATARAVLPDQWERVAAHEDRFGKTIKRRESLRVLTGRGVAYRHDPADAEAARRETFDEPVLLPAGTWRLPAGAFAGDSCGPT
jgi:3'-phosphoadenosine 5'-phosphosulfate sulfotransferase (PAPS reductase)/FAD synthetase